MTIFLGLAAGFINGLFGTGAGMIVLPGLISLFSMDNKVARGTSLFILLIISSITSIFYAKNITDYNALWYIAVGGILGGVIGAKYAKIIPERLLKVILGVLMIISGIRMLIK